ncbi:MAG: ferrous iron transport protein A [Treponema sp.]|nr:ferrous iron transport protein A [Treponema sp.]
MTRVDQTQDSRNLYEARQGGTFFLCSVPPIPLLENMGLRAGTQVKLQNRYALGGPVLLRVEGAFDLALGKEVAQGIRVQES